MADAFGGELLDFPVTWNRLNFLVGRIFPDGVAAAFANQRGGSDDCPVGARRSGASPWKGAGGRWKALVSVKMSGVMKIKMKELS